RSPERSRFPPTRNRNLVLGGLGEDARSSHGRTPWRGGTHPPAIKSWTPCKSHRRRPPSLTPHGMRPASARRRTVRGEQPSSRPTSRPSTNRRREGASGAL